MDKPAAFSVARVPGRFNQVVGYAIACGRWLAAAGTLAIAQWHSRRLLAAEQRELPGAVRSILRMLAVRLAPLRFQKTAVRLAPLRFQKTAVRLAPLRCQNICRSASGACLAFWLAAAASGQVIDDPHADAQRLRFFEQRIESVLVSRCYECHSGQAASIEGGLRLDSRDSMLHGGDSGPAIVPGETASSLLLEAIGSGEMPPDAPLSAEQIEDFRTWVLTGAADSRPAFSLPAEGEPNYESSRDYWAFQPLPMPADQPRLEHDDWSSSPVDQFVWQKLREQGLDPAPAASPEVLIRRLYFDLIGLPPEPDAIARFVDQPSPAAYQQLVDQLLASPQYGERSAQHWLDVVRYAETEGFEYDRIMPDAWRYRDYVISAFNADKPYDRFLCEQLAGDEMDARNSELRIAAGFHRLGAVRRNAGNQKVASSRNEVLTERTDIIGTVILGLTIGCARCHDHKFDPISQQDYYRLQAFFAATREENVPFEATAEQRERLAQAEALEAKIAELKEIVSNLSGDEEQQVREQIEQLESQLPPPGPTICSIANDFAEFEPVHVLRRGNAESPQRLVGMRLPGVLVRHDQPELPPMSERPRTILAQELTGALRPLTARVFVNRLWQQHFGVGLVSTSNDFGNNGTPPSHPELLDYLASEFVSSGWQIKSLHRLIVTSHTYQQASTSQHHRKAMAIDPANRWLWHFPRRRLSGEEIRDAMLSVSGRLNPSMGGPSVLLPVEQELIDQLYKPSQWEVSSQLDQHLRRSIYLIAKRNLRLPFLEVFDQPSAQTSCAAREQSTHARQALELLNGAIANEMATALARRLIADVDSDAEAIVDRAYRLLCGREPNPRERALSQAMLEEVGLHEYALAMLNLNAFLYVD